MDKTQSELSRIALTDSGGIDTAEITPDGEMWGTATERENNVGTELTLTGLTATEYFILVSLLNSDVFPHRLQGQATDRIDVSGLGISLTLANITELTLRFGVISAITGSDAEIRYISNLPLLFQLRGSASVFYNLSPSQIKFGLNAGQLTHLLSNKTESAVAAVNTGTTLTSPTGPIVPGVGDVVMKLEYVGGTIEVLSILTLYHGH